MARSRSMLCGALFPFLLVASIAPAISGEPRPEAQPITLERLLEFKSAKGGTVRWTRGGGALLLTYTNTRGEPPTNVLLDLRTGSQLTLPSGAHASISPDGQWFLRPAVRSWQVLSLPGGKDDTVIGAEPLGATMFYPPVWSPDSRFVALALLHSESNAAEDVQQQGNVRFIDLGLSRQRRPAMQTVVAVIDAARHEVARSWRLSGRTNHLRWGRGHTLYGDYTLGFESSENRISTRVLRFNPDSESPIEVFRTDGYMQQMAPVPSPDGSRLALAFDADSRRWDDFVSLSVLDLQSRRTKRMTTDLYVTRAQYAWSVDGSSIFFIGRQGGYDQIFRSSMEGGVSRLSTCACRHFDLQIAPDGKRLSYQTEDGYGRRDVRIYDTGSAQERVVHTFSDPTRTFALGEFRAISWPSFDGLTLRGFLVFPPDFNPSRRYPLLVDVHGGGPSASLYFSGALTSGLLSTPLEWHVWAKRGFVVFLPDYRSSGEYGPEVARARYEQLDYSGVKADAADVEAGVQSVTKYPFIDPARVAIFGHSAGGARVHYLLTVSTAYAAAAIVDPTGAGPQESLIITTTGPNGRSNFEPSLRNQLGGGIRQLPDAYRSGFMFDGYRVTTPVLILMGGDRSKGGSPALSPEILFSVLQQYGVPARFIRYVDEGHNFRSPDVIRHAFAEVEEWFSRYVRARN